MICRGSGFLAVVRFGPSPTPLTPIFRQQIVSLSQSFCVSPVEHTNGGKGGWGAKSYDREKAWPSTNHSVLSVKDYVSVKGVILKCFDIAAQNIASFRGISCYIQTISATEHVSSKRIKKIFYRMQKTTGPRSILATRKTKSNALFINLLSSSAQYR